MVQLKFTNYVWSHFIPLNALYQAAKLMGDDMTRLDPSWPHLTPIDSPWPHFALLYHTWPNLPSLAPVKQIFWKAFQTHGWMHWRTHLLSCLSQQKIARSNLSICSVLVLPTIYTLCLKTLRYGLTSCLIFSVYYLYLVLVLVSHLILLVCKV